MDVGRTCDKCSVVVRCVVACESLALSTVVDGVDCSPTAVGLCDAVACTHLTFSAHDAPTARSALHIYIYTALQHIDH